MVESILCTGQGTNCAEDLDNFLLSLDSLPVSGEGAFQDEPLPAYESLIATLPENVRSIMSVCSFTQDVSAASDELTFSESNILAYIAGYVVRKVRGKMCPDCASSLVCSEEEDDNDALSFIKCKNYSDAKEGLIRPSKSLLDVVESVEQTYRDIIENVMYSENVKCTLLSTITKKVNFEQFLCSVCNLHMLLVHIIVNIRLHHTMKLVNKSLLHHKGKVNRKGMKFAHL